MSKCKYAMREHQVSYDNGLTWTALEVIKGDLIEYQSADCPDSGSEITKWVDLENDFLCEENRKYKKQILYVSYDDGVTWYIYFPTVYQKGEYVGVDNEFCAEKFEGHYTTGSGKILDPLKIVKCNDSSTLSSAETQYYVSNYTLISGKVGNCVERIGDRAFMAYNRLSSITISDSVKEIGDRSFHSCSGLTRFNSTVDGECNIPDSVTDIETNAFINCYSLRTVKLSSNISQLYNGTFAHCSGLTSVTIPSGVTSIGNDVFIDCKALPSLVIPSGVTSIGNYAFSGCTNLTSVTVNAITPPTLGTNAFYKSDNCLIYVPCQSVEAYKTAPNWSTYASRIQDTSVYRWIDDGTMCDNANKYNKEKQQASCDSGTTWTDTGQVRKKSEIPIETDSYECGYRTRTLTSSTICIDKDLYELDEYQESRDSGLTWTTTATSATTLIESGASECEFTGKFKATYSDSTTYSAECNSSSALTTATTRAHSTSYTAMTSAIVGNCVTSISQNTFRGCTSLTSIDIPNSVTSIGDNTFYNCASLTSIDIPNSVTSIGDGTFQRCSGLTSINIPSGVTSIGNRTFEYCYALSSVTMGSGVTSIGNDAFYHCSGLTSIDIPSGVTSIGTAAFVSCSGLTSINIPSGVTSIGANTFWDCASLTSIDIPNSVTSIGAIAFGGCSSLTSCTIGSGVTSIDGSAFSGCRSLTSIDIPNSVTSIGNGAFGGCSSLTSCTIGSGVTSIDGSAFASATSLTSIDIPSSVTYIGNYAFYYCKGLTSVTIGSGVTEIGDSAFGGCTNLTSITINATTPPTLGSYPFSVYDPFYIYVPAQSVNAYKKATGWSRYSSRIQAIP